MPDDGRIYMAELTAVMLKQKYKQKVYEFETSTTLDDHYMDEKIDEAIAAVDWVLSALAALGYTLRRTGATLIDQLNN